MAKYFVEDTSLTAVADAIRTKGGTTESLSFPDGFVSAVEGIIAGGGGEEYDKIYDAFILKNLTEYRNDKVTELYDNTFTGWRVGIRLIFPNVTKKSNYLFMSCGNIKSVDFGKYLSFGVYEFHGCSAIRTLILRSNQLCPLGNTNVFYNSPFQSGKSGGVLLIPSALVESYTTATNWSVLYGYDTNRFLALEDYTVDGTASGEIDWDKVNALFEEA